MKGVYTMDKKKVTSLAVACAGGLAAVGLIKKALSANGDAVEALADGIKEEEQKCCLNTLCLKADDKSVDVPLAELTVDSLRDAGFDVYCGDNGFDTPFDAELFTVYKGSEFVGTGTRCIDSGKINELQITNPKFVTIKDIGKWIATDTTYKLDIITTVCNREAFEDTDTRSSQITYAVRAESGMILMTVDYSITDHSYHNELKAFSWVDKK